MLNKYQILGRLMGLGLLLSITSTIPATAAPATEASTQIGQFRRIEQPLALKLGVTIGGAALIGLELWWFVLSKHQASQARANQDAD
jgi:plastocyanin domain-containing protein